MHERYQAFCKICKKSIKDLYFIPNCLHLRFGECNLKTWLKHSIMQEFQLKHFWTTYVRIPFEISSHLTKSQHFLHIFPTHITKATEFSRKKFPMLFYKIIAFENKIIFLQNYKGEIISYSSMTRKLLLNVLFSSPLLILIVYLLEIQVMWLVVILA